MGHLKDSFYEGQLNPPQSKDDGRTFPYRLGAIQLPCRLLLAGLLGELVENLHRRMEAVVKATLMFLFPMKR